MEIADGIEHAHDLIEAMFFRTGAPRQDGYEFSTSAVVAILKAAPAESALDDGGMGGYFYLDGEALQACESTEIREDCAVDVNRSAWEPERGYFEGGTADQAARCLRARQIRPLTDFPA